MSFRVGPAWITGSFVVGNQGGGVLAENLANTGSDGTGFLYNDVTLPGDNGKEICGRILSVAPGLNFYAFENGGAIASAAVSGTYVVMYQLYVDYVATGSPTSITYVIGAGDVTASAAWVEGADVVAAAVNVVSSTVTAAAGWVEGADVVVAALSVAGSFTAAIGWTEGADVCAASVQVESQYARAPSGPGYSPRAGTRSVRPPQIQE